MKWIATILIVLLFATTAQGAIRAMPEITSVALDTENPDVIYIRIANLRLCEAAVSHDAGASFEPIAEGSIPNNLTTDLNRGVRRYFLLGSACLLRSDDSGVTWTETGARKLLNDHVDAEIKQEKEWFREAYGKRLPDRSRLWHFLFILVAALHCLLVDFALRKQSWLRALAKALPALVVLFLAWCLLVCFHYYFIVSTREQWPLAHWLSGAECNPSSKTGFIMGIAARPLWLLAYLLALWPVLPSSLDTVLALGGNRTALRQRIWGVFFAVWAVGMLAFHFCMLFVGHFFE